MKCIFLALIKFYQFFISPWLGKNCRFEPTCSEYAYHAIDSYGIIKGLILGFRRILRCQPFSKGGYDPLPKNTNE